MKRVVNVLNRLIGGRSACVAFLLCAATAVALPAQTFTKLFNFDTTDGYEPMAGLVQGADGDFYGTTPYGGANPQTYCNGCAGTVFKITPSGTLTTLYNFCSQSGCMDGEAPYAGLVQGADGDFYGTTEGGGANGGGTVFKITPEGRLTTLYSFCALIDCADGDAPMAGLIQGNGGDFYGTNANGGANLGIRPGGGTVFKITPNGALTILYSFCSQTGCADGQNTYAGLVQGTDGDFYGTTYLGGATGNGTVFKITPTGTLTTLYSFCTEGVYPACPDGAWPNAALVQASDGRFYGTTPTGGANQLCGTAFEITISGAFTTLHSFCSRFECVDGANPQAGVVQGTNGDFYGTTLGGGGLGLFGDGTIFRLSVGLGPFVKTLPHYGNVGTAITILGTDLTGTTSVSFNGTPAAFEVVSATEITTSVPAGATTGSVQVTTPGGTLLSGGPFLVQP